MALCDILVLAHCGISCVNFALKNLLFCLSESFVFTYETETIDFFFFFQKNSNLISVRNQKKEYPTFKLYYIYTE